MSKIAPYLQSNWDWRAAGNFIGGGTGAGLIIAAAWSWLDGFPFWLLGGLALIFIGLGLLCVWAEIGRPLRALHVFFHPSTSWMTREAIIALPLGLFVIMAMASNYGWLFQDGGAGTILISAGIAIVYLYCQARILREAKGIPAWRHRSLMPLMIVTGFAEGFAVVAIIALFFNELNPWLGNFIILFAVMRTIGWLNYLYEMKKGGAPQKAVAVLRSITLPNLAAGHLLPALLAGAAIAVEAWSGPLNALAGLLLLAGGWHMKFVIVAKASFNQGFAIPQMPIRGKGKIKGAAKPGWD